MQTTTVVLTVFLGIVAVLQGAINRLVASAWGLTPAILLNNLVILVLGFLFYAAVKFYPEWFPESFADKAGFTQWSWYYFLPGLCGLIIITGIPFAISKIGAAEVFVGIVA